MGSIGTMNATINNNRQLLNSVRRKSIYEKPFRSSKRSESNRYVLPELPPHVLRRIRIKIKREQRRLQLTKVVIASAVVLTLVLLYVLKL